MKRMKRFAWIMFIGFVLVVLLIGGCEVEEEKEEVTEHVTMQWGIPEDVTGFEGLERAPEGEEVGKVNQDGLDVVWHVGESYILPISSTADTALEGVRYYGQNIPDHLEVEWLDPHAREWYPVEEIPAEQVEVHIEQENDVIAMDFGPPEGADFDEGMTRVIWFRLTPQVELEWEMEIYGYQMEEDNALGNRISNIIKFEAEAIAP